jgi:hypothetical protein
MTDTTPNLAELYATIREAERKLPVLLVGLDDYERVEQAAHQLPFGPEVLWCEYIPPGMVVATTLGKLTDPFPHKENR